MTGKQSYAERLRLQALKEDFNQKQNHDLQQRRTRLPHRLSLCSTSRRGKEKGRNTGEMPAPCGTWVGCCEDTTPLLTTAATSQ